MGQYYNICNLDRAERLHPHEMGDGLKLLEFGSSGRGTLSGLAALLLFTTEGEGLRGAWVGNRVVVTGDYADEGRFVPPEFSKFNLYTYAAGYHVEQAESEGERPAPPYAEISSQAKTAVEKLNLGWTISSSSFGGGSAFAFVPAIDDEAAVFEQPEDLLAAFGLEPTENLSECISDIFRELRFAQVKSALIWGRSEVKVTQETDERAGAVLQWNLNTTDEPLTFPANAESVRKWLRVEDCLSMSRPKLLP